MPFVHFARKASFENLFSKMKFRARRMWANLALATKLKINKIKSMKQKTSLDDD